MVKDSNPSLKKKRKVDDSEKETETDLYKRVVEFEEKEAVNHKNSQDAKMFFDLCQDIRESIQRIHAHKKNASSKESVLKELQFDIFVKLCIIKKLNRIDKLKHVVERETLAVEKQKCDSIKLNYQNLVYELQHLVGEIKKCLAFKSKDEDIELVPFEEFMKDAPKALTEKFIEYNPGDPEQAHSLRLTRLEWELTQRKNLAQLCKSLVEEKQKLEEDLIEHREKLSALGPLLENVVKATHPLQEHLQISEHERRVEHHLAPLLPEPLYIFYVHIAAYRSVHNINLEVEVLGDATDAEQWKEAAELSDILNEEESEQEADAQEIEEVIKPKKRRHRKSAVQEVEEVDPLEEKKKKLLKTHPLSIQVTAAIDQHFSLVMQLRYYDKLKIITVSSDVKIPSDVTANTAREILCGESVLSGLTDDDDDGRESPNPAVSYQLKRAGFSCFAQVVNEIGHPYRWAQRVCGTDFLTKQTNDSKIANSNVETVVKSLFKSLKARYDLAKQMQMLEQNKVSEVPTSLDLPPIVGSFPSKWSSATYHQFCQAEFTQHQLEEELVSSSDMFYSLRVSRDNAVLDAFVVIRKNYPVVPPLFALSVNYEKKKHHFLNCEDIRDIERTINTSWAITSGKESSWLLAAQVTNLCACLDMFLETTFPAKFSQKTSFIWSSCGRNRRRPYKYKKMGTGLFTQY
ncbi:unnamed protein product [Acanthoscelides obtectus]|uniref:THO complex subunit 5 n=1 Tax=Acanthoscelides obtectus TaxID=200917 RepID=A0A9P0P6K8_ACAOB|nr:unnamed protein product [Acanthoscelides obtectus]CAK1672688.1 THO complex subunit 5 homolog [Acanthoscelides obtectus]